jgi:hypothetical protein
MDTHVSPIIVHDARKKAKYLQSLLVAISLWEIIDHNHLMQENVSVIVDVMVNILSHNMCLYRLFSDVLPILLVTSISLLSLFLILSLVHSNK